MGFGRLAATTAACLLVAAGPVTVGAAPASADQVWHQSVGRSSVDALCPQSENDDLEAGWSPWAASWERWANDGTGGWTCYRSITWAKDTPPPAATVFVVSGCLQSESGPNTYLLFGAANALPIGTQVYTDADCLLPFSPARTINAWFVAANDQRTAQAICSDVLRREQVRVYDLVGDSRVFICLLP